ncbi:gamma-glutamyl-gamma-aminobutyrate hydrolase [Carnimonas bestiolae]|uniref:gamma-glutamyl-gamma-aminobutyrate hydrolase n=1 Tax=Carnimonas bestiolae TaxID=3402172 RepID=UPI003EDC79FE
MEEISAVPLIGVVADSGLHGGQHSQNVKDKYLHALALAGAAPVILPQGLMAAPEQLERALSVLDGIFLTGSASNIEPHHYLSAEQGEDLSPEAHPDAGRDQLAFALIDHALERSMPLLTVCRGTQELVVRTGGKLFRRLWEQPGLIEHREDTSADLATQYAPAHGFSIAAGHHLSELMGDTTEWRVNSLHGQGIATLGDRLDVEGRAEDGLIEAVSVAGHPFALGVQWHPEWNSRDDALSCRLFDAFIAQAQRFHARTHSNGEAV